MSNHFMLNGHELFNNENKHNDLIADTAIATLWMGDLEMWMDEDYLKQLWLSYGEHVVVKLIRDKRTSMSCGYAFIGFSSLLAAERALSIIHGTRIPNTMKSFKLNWASGGGICDRREDRTPEYSLFVGDLSADVDETYLLSLFRGRYPSCHSAKIMTAPGSGISRGYGFVRFLNKLEQQEAVTEMNGIICDNRPIRVSYATPKTSTNRRIDSNQQSNARYMQLSLQAPALVHQHTDPNNTTVFVGGLSSPVTEAELAQCFAPFGEVTYVKIPPGKGCGFVQYVSRQSAEQAIEKMNGFLIGNSRIRLSWGRSQADKSCELNKSPSSNATQSSSSLPQFSSSFRPLSPPSSLLYDNTLFRSNSDFYNDNDEWLIDLADPQIIKEQHLPRPYTNSFKEWQAHDSDALY